MDSETIINELKERGVSMNVCVDNVALWWDTMYFKWCVQRGYGKSPKSVLYRGDDFWQAFASLCGATQHGVQSDR